MNKMYFKFGLLFLSGFFCTAIIAEGPVKSYTFPNGKTIENPYVISERPDGLEVGHKNGVMFVKFKDLPEEIQKKFNYDPAKAEAYEKKIAADKAAFQKKKADQAARLKEEQEKQRKQMVEWNKEKLVGEISKTENRIAFLKTEIPKLEKQCDDLLNKTTTLAGTDLSNSGNSSSNNGNTYNSGNGYCWGEGYVLVSGGSGSRAETTKRKTISGLSDEYTSAKRKLDQYKIEIQKKNDDLDSMKRRQEKSTRAE